MYKVRINFDLVSFTFQICLVTRYAVVGTSDATSMKSEL